MKLTHILIFLIAGTFLGRLIMLYQEQDIDNWELFGMGLLVIITIFLIGLYDKRNQKPKE